MIQNATNIQQQYQGFLNTEFLLGEKTVNGLTPFNIQHITNRVFMINMPHHLMLGKRVERFVSHILQHHEDITILQENIQINHHKITIGELDCLLLYHNSPIHLEIVYKFYLYDDSVGYTELDHLIGPNRKDSLIEKLEKLQHKQLPLLHRPEVTSVLNKLGYLATDFVQRVYFKAQIFLPIHQQHIVFNDFNNDCITGFYARLSELERYRNSKFFIPEKIDWLVRPHRQVSWINFDRFTSIIKKHLTIPKAPLCWLQTPNGELLQFFVVWW